MAISEEAKETSLKVPDSPLEDSFRMSSRLSESIKDMIKIPQMQVAQAATDALKNITSPLTLQLREMMNNIETSIFEAFKPDLSGIADAARQMLVDLGETLKGITFAAISEEQKERLLQAHKQWGEYGWTINPCASIDTLFDNSPSDKKAADRIALNECSNASMKELFIRIAEMKHYKKLDFEEAVFDYENKKYKSCALMLFALIDAKLIRLQKDSTLNGRGRSVGAKAVEKAKRRAAGITEDHMLFTMLFQANLFACLEKVFEKGNDFRNQPVVLNRNFLDHGMLTRQVTRKDCVQLFLLYYNILELLDMIYQ